MKKFLWLRCILATLTSYAQNNIGIYTTNPQSQLHTTRTVRHEVFERCNVDKETPCTSGMA